MVHHYEYSTINSHHKVLVNLHASGMLSRMDPGYHVLDGVQMLQREGALLGECMAHCKA